LAPAQISLRGDRTGASTVPASGTPSAGSKDRSSGSTADHAVSTSARSA
jgi:hypothetical protein